MEYPCSIDKDAPLFGTDIPSAQGEINRAERCQEQPIDRLVAHSIQQTGEPYAEAVKRATANRSFQQYQTDEGIGNWGE